MTTTQTAALHRGVCVENRDPLGMGRIRVQVPALLGAGVSGWAFPAWTGNDTAVWPIDRLPAPGEGVWVGFEAPDRMTWTAVFGPVHGPISDGPEMYITRAVMPVGVLTENTPTPLPGRLTSPSGTPNPPPIVVHLEKSQDYVPGEGWNAPPVVPGTWTRLGSAPVELDGDFILNYSRPTGEDDWWYRCAFDGREPFTACTSLPGQSQNSATVITWNAAAPVWQRPVTYSGTLKAGDGSDMAGKIVGVIVNDGSGWKVAQTTVCTAGGAWTLTWTQPYAMTAALSMAAVFDGDEVYDTSTTSVSQWPAVSVPTSIAWTIPPMEVQQPKTITGSLTTAEYGIPEPERTLDFMSKPSGAAWAVVAKTTADATTGAWSFQYTAVSGICEYKMRFPGSGVFQASESTVSSQENAVTTTATAPVIEPNLYYGVSHTMTGTVSDQTGARVKRGTVQMQVRRSDAGNTWYDFNPPVNVSTTGTWSAPGQPDFVGPADYRAQYLGSSDGFYLPSTSPHTSRNVGLKAMGNLTKGAVSHTSAAFSWSAVAGATSYAIYHQASSGGAFNWWKTVTTTSTSHTGLGNDQYHGYKVYAERYTAGNVLVSSAPSNAIAMNTGHPESRASGSFANSEWVLTCRSWRTGDNSWGPWGSFGGPDQVIQGTYSGRSYDGVMQPDSGGFQTWVRNNYGQHVLDHMKNTPSTWTQCAIFLNRIANSGSTTDAITLRWNVSSARVGVTSGPHSYAGGDTGKGSLTHTEGKWFYLIPHWAGHVLFNENVGGTGVCYSFMLEYDSTNHYMRCYGSQSGYPHGHLSVSASWNFVTVSASAAAWY